MAASPLKLAKCLIYPTNPTGRDNGLKIHTVMVRIHRGILLRVLQALQQPVPLKPINMS